MQVPPYLAVWVGTELVNEGRVPTSPSQQAALYQFLVPFGPTWTYTDSDGDVITIASESDLSEACLETEPSGGVLHISNNLHAEDLPSLRLRHRRKQFIDATRSTPLRTLHSYNQACSAPVEVRTLEQIQRDIPRTYLVRHLHNGPEHPLCKQAEKVLCAFAGMRPAIGYCQGMNSVAVAILLMVQSGPTPHSPRHVTLPSEACMPPVGSPRPPAPLVPETGLQPESDLADALAILCHWADMILPPAFWANTGELHLDSLAAVQSAAAVVGRILQHRQPALAEEIESQMPLDVFACRLLPPLFVGLLPLETALVVWDAVLEQGAPFLMLAAASVVELALLPVLEAGLPLGPDTIFTEMERFSQTCYNSQQLVDLCGNNSPSFENVSGWFTEAMISQMEHSHATESWQAAFSDEMVDAAESSKDDDWQDVGKDSGMEGTEVDGAHELVDTNTALDHIVNIAGGVEHGITELGTAVLNTATSVHGFVHEARLSGKLRGKLVKASSSGACETVAECIAEADDPLMLVNSTKKVSWRGLDITPLIAAAKHGHPQVVSMLLEAKADAEAKDWWGLTALDYATKRSQSHPAEPRSCEMLRCAMEGNAGSRRSSANLMTADGLVNDEGAFMQPSSSSGCVGKLYCGRYFTSISDGISGRCGPDEGPQCASCQRYMHAVQDTVGEQAQAVVNEPDSVATPQSDADSELDELLNICFEHLKIAETYEASGAVASAVGCYSEALRGLEEAIPLQEKRSRRQAAAVGWNALPDMRAAQLLRAKQEEYVQVQQNLIQRAAGLACYEQCQPLSRHNSSER